MGKIELDNFKEFKKSTIPFNSFSSLFQEYADKEELPADIVNHYLKITEALDKNKYEYMKLEDSEIVERLINDDDVRVEPQQLEFLTNRIDSIKKYMEEISMIAARSRLRKTISDGGSFAMRDVDLLSKYISATENKINPIKYYVFNRNYTDPKLVKG